MSNKSKRHQQQLLTMMGRVYACLRDLLCGKRGDGPDLTMTMSVKEWWSVVIALERASESFREARPSANCHHVWERLGDPCRSDGYWYQCKRCGRFSR